MPITARIRASTASVKPHEDVRHDIAMLEARQPAGSTLDVYRHLHHCMRTLDKSIFAGSIA